MPDNLEKYDKIEIEQAYLNYVGKTILRLRKYNQNEYILSYKSKKKGYENNLSVCDEIELSLSKEAYESLMTKIEGRTIYKTRYIIPLKDGLKVEIDRFHDFFLMVYALQK